MFDSDILEVAIGLSMVFALVSTICTAVREGVESFLKTRASYLEYGIRQLLNDPHARGIAKDVFNHPMVSGLYIGNFDAPNDKPPVAKSTEGAPDKDPPPGRKLKAQNPNLPSYIPAKNFATALIDVVARGPSSDVAADSSSQPITLARLRGNLAHVDNPHLRRALLLALDSSEGDLTRLRTNIETWYDSAMDRVSGWYKRTTQKMLFLIALVLVVSLNVNAVTVADYLFRHDAERAALVAGIEAPATDPAQKLTYDEATQKLNSMHLPIGWTQGWGAPRARTERLEVACKKITEEQANKVCKDTADVDAAWDDIFGPMVGWLVTALAAMLGAPFWFDLLSKFTTVRSTLKPRDEKKDDQAAGAALTKTGATASTLTATIEASIDAHAVDDHCGVGSNVSVTTDDRLPIATGGVA